MGKLLNCWTKSFLRTILQSKRRSVIYQENFWIGHYFGKIIENFVQNQESNRFSVKMCGLLYTVSDK